MFYTVSIFDQNKVFTFVITKVALLCNLCPFLFFTFKMLLHDIALFFSAYWPQMSGFCHSLTLFRSGWGNVWCTLTGRFPVTEFPA